MPTTTTEYVSAIMAAGLLVVGLLIAPAGGVPAPPDGHGGGNGGGGGGGENPTPSHRFQSLGTFPGTEGGSKIHDINADGMVVGEASGRAFLIVPEDVDDDGELDWFYDDPNDNAAGNSLMKDLGCMPGYAGLQSDSSAAGINDSGCIVGEIRAGSDFRAFLIVPEDVDGDGELDWFHDDPNDGVAGNALMIDVTGAPLDVAWAVNRAWGINEAGHIVGQYRNASTTPRGLPFIIVPEDTDGDGYGDTWFRDEPPDPDDPDSVADGVNDLMITLGAMDLAGGFAMHVNDGGWVIGTLVNGIGSNVAWFVVVPEDTDDDGVPDTWFRDEPPDPNDPNSVPDGVNDLMFAYYDSPFPPGYPNELGLFAYDLAVWQFDQFTGAIDLVYSLEEAPSKLGPASACAMNDSGGVVGRAFKQKGQFYWQGSYIPLYWQDGVVFNLFDLMTSDDDIEDAEATGIDDWDRLYGVAPGWSGTAFIAIPIVPAP